MQAGVVATRPDGCDSVKWPRHDGFICLSMRPGGKCGTHAGFGVNPSKRVCGQARLDVIKPRIRISPAWPAARNRPTYEAYDREL